MSELLGVRENLRNFYSRHELYIVPVLKFLLALTVILSINVTMGHMRAVNNFVVVLVVSLLCSFLPLNFIVVAAAGFVLMHMYAISLECLLVGAAIFSLMFLLYFRFVPKDTFLVLLMPLFFVFKIPYAIPIAAGLLGTPVSVVSISCGLIAYYLVEYTALSATAISSVEADNAVARLRYIVDGMTGNQEMFVTVLTFCGAVVIVWFIRRLSLDHAWTIAIVVGLVFNVMALLIGDLMFDTGVQIVALLLGTLVSFFLVKVLQFFVFNVDYTRANYVQFEDDEYYYYVKTIPKNAVAKAQKTVKKITNNKV